MRSQLRDADTHTTQTTTMIDDNFAMNQLEELHEAISVLASGINTLNADTQRLNTELIEHETKLQNLIENVSKVKIAVEEDNALLDEKPRKTDVINQDLASLQEKIDDMQYVSYDGTFTWKIPKFQEKMSK